MDNISLPKDINQIPYLFIYILNKNFFGN